MSFRFRLFSCTVVASMEESSLPYTGLLAMFVFTLGACLSLAAWIYLCGLHGRFWLADQRLSLGRTEIPPGRILAVVPARNEDAVLKTSLISLLNQNGLSIVLVDDHSTDNTRAIAQTLAIAHPDRLRVVSPPPLPAGWSGKLWALQTGMEAVDAGAEWLLLTDADIHHGPATVSRLYALVQNRDLDMASLMARLDERGPWGALLIPAFVYFFQMLYPFRWVNDPFKKTAGAAGGCILVKRAALDRVGGIAAIRGALIDDCWLAGAVKRSGGRIWLGLADDLNSLRPNGGLPGIWDMVARTAYTQLRYSPFLLAGTVLGLALVYLGPVAGAVAWWALGGEPFGGLAGLAAWGLMSITFMPTLRLYRRRVALAPLLPVAALLYSLMTVSSAWRHWRGRGGAWKGRTYPAKGGLK